MNKRPESAAGRVDMHVLNRLGASLRKATASVPEEELPEDIQRLLRELERREAAGNPPPDRTKADPAD